MYVYPTAILMNQPERLTSTWLIRLMWQDFRLNRKDQPFPVLLVDLLKLLDL
jgi:hypothetical protein